MARRGKAVLNVQSELMPLLREVLARGGHLPLVARGASMRPALADGDRLVVGPLGNSPLHPGDVVVWSHLGRVAAHRVVELGAGKAKTRGDACSRDDGWIPLSSILGRVTRAEASHWRGSILLRRMLSRVGLLGAIRRGRRYLLRKLRHPWV